ncbi:MAG: hypothetical protein GY750_14095 [Lentisphaerae bacterium]|nr:hypothetical protein [Lentisphaerota bacterium]MCP4102531.1 hypothetical protein [Lentisphaerota bacterium]
MKKMLFLLALPVIFVLLQGCASGFEERQKAVKVTAGKPGTEFVVHDRAGALIYKGTTPDLVPLKASSGAFKKEIYTISYADGKIIKEVPAEISIYFWGNFITILGFLPDGFNGLMWTLPKGVHLDGYMPTQK